ncbi:cytochrome P450 [Capsulimonas corticalis]|uniref:Cytochrome P450 n=1 Tax=Capsulimonas corticalis TaxID=2219043 RepID=A0A402D1Z7_9BACT|nr:cytochrome P450 [Capsulimonas corticalis]BDI30080.1 cytochrome P450 [Capsulimonas corticalis]
MPTLPPGPRSATLFASARLYRRDPIHFLRSLTHDYGDIVSFQIGPQPMLLVNHPDLIRDVLVTHAKQFHKGRGLQRAKRLLGDGLLTSEGPYHLRQRRMMQPAFHRQRIAEYGLVMASEAERAAQWWRDGDTVDVAEEMMRLTLGIVGKTLFGADVENEAAEISSALGEAIQLFHLLMLPFADVLARLPLPQVRRFNAARARLDAVIYRMIAEHRRTDDDRGDLLSMLLAARDEDEDGARMTDEQVRDEAMTIFLAGHETTANALSWTWYLLSEHPEAEAALHAELAGALGGRIPNIADLPALPYTRKVLAESMRLYPPAWVIGRRAVTPYAIGEYTIPPGTVFLVSQSVTHHDARFYQDPERFDPTRWTPEFEAALPKFAYYPFGGGPRVCIGEQFAWMELILVLAALAQRWRFRLVPGHPIATMPIITLRPRHGIRMTAEKR